MKATFDPNISHRDFTELYRRHCSRFIHVAYGYVRDMQAAEDIVTDSFLAFWETRDKLPAGSNYLAYIMTIVRNRCLNWLNRRKLSVEVNEKLQTRQLRIINNSITSLEYCDPHELFENEVAGIVEAELDKMPELRRRIFRANKFDNKNCREISREMGITYRIANYELNKALDILVKALRDYLVLFLLFLLPLFW